MTIRYLAIKDVKAVFALMAEDTEDYQQYFTPWASIDDLLHAIRSGQPHWGIYPCANRLGGFFFARIHRDYPHPSFGVYIGELFARKGLGALALDTTISWCRFYGVDKLRLTVAQENLVAKWMYERRGFVATGVVSAKGHLEYLKDLTTDRGTR